VTTAGDERAALRLLIDACPSPAVVIHLSILFGARVDAVHIDRIARPGMPDKAVFDLAQRDQRAVVTANIRDFLALARTRPDHSGLVLVDDQNTRERQTAAIARIVTAMLARTEASTAGRVFTWRAASDRLVDRAWP
jgi:predicted nuclease of predicted toxin-antitoxin system